MQQCNALLVNGKRCHQIAVIGETLCASHLGSPSPVPLFQFAQYSEIVSSRSVSRQEYHAYLESEQWKQKAAAKKRENPRCSLCNRTSKVMHTHHRTYVRCGNEAEFDLTVLCDDCHKMFHQNYDYSDNAGCFIPRQSAQHSVHLTSGTHPAKQSFSKPKHFRGRKGRSKPTRRK